MNRITTSELLQYAYEDLYVQRALAIKTAIEVDNRVRDKYSAVKAAKDILDEMPLLSPRKEAIDKILNHAKQSLNKNNQ